MNNLFSIALLLASVGVFFGYINPTYTAVTGSSDNKVKSVQELQATEKDYNDAFSKTREIKAIYDGLLKKYNTISGTANDDKIAKLLPDHIDSVRLIIDLNNIAFKYGMSLSNILLTAPGAQNVPSKVGEVPGQTASAQAATALPTVIGPNYRLYDSVKLGFSVTGSYSNFVSFVRELESSLRLVDIISLSFTTSKTGQQASVSSPLATPAGSDIYTYVLTVKTYYLK